MLSKIQYSIQLYEKLFKPFDFKNDQFDVFCQDLKDTFVSREIVRIFDVAEDMKMKTIDTDSVDVDYGKEYDIVINNIQFKWIYVNDFPTLYKRIVDIILEIKDEKKHNIMTYYFTRETNDIQEFESEPEFELVEKVKIIQGDEFYKWYGEKPYHVFLVYKLKNPELDMLLDNNNNIIKK